MKTQISIIKSLAIAMTLTALLVATSVQAAPQTEKSLYERLGGVFAIAAVVDHFSDAVVKNPIVGKTSKNPALRKWHTEEPGQVAGPQVHANPVGLRRSRAGHSNSRQQSRERLNWVLRRRIVTSKSRQKNSTRSRPS